MRDDRDVEVEGDGELVRRSRDGDREAFATLYSRHRSASLGLARLLGEIDEAEDCVAEAFAAVLRQLDAGGGPRENVRAYLQMAVRRQVYRRAAERRRTVVSDELPDDGVEDGHDVRLDGMAAVRAWESLPERWRTIVWALEVEGLKPRQVADQLGIRANTVAALAYRARGALREAYLAEHLPSAASLPRDCVRCREHLPALVRGSLSPGRSKRAHAHLSQCAGCRAVEQALQEENRRVAAWLGVPLFGLAAAPGTWSLPSLKWGLAKAGLGLGAATPLAGGSLAALVVLPLLVVPYVPYVPDDRPGGPGSLSVQPPAEAGLRGPQIVGLDPSPRGGPPEADHRAARVEEQGLVRSQIQRAAGPDDPVPAPGPSRAYSPPKPGDPDGSGFVVSEVSRSHHETRTSSTTMTQSSVDPSVTWMVRDVRTETTTDVIRSESSSGSDDDLCGVGGPVRRDVELTVVTETVTLSGYRTLADGTQVPVREVSSREIRRDVRGVWTGSSGPCAGFSPEFTLALVPKEPVSVPEASIPDPPAQEQSDAVAPEVGDDQRVASTSDDAEADRDTELQRDSDGGDDEDHGSGSRATEDGT